VSRAATSHSRSSTTNRDVFFDYLDLAARPVQLDVERAAATRRREQRAFVVEAGGRSDCPARCGRRVPRFAG